MPAPTMTASYVFVALMCLSSCSRSDKLRPHALVRRKLRLAVEVQTRPQSPVGRLVPVAEVLRAVAHRVRLDPRPHQSARVLVVRGRAEDVDALCVLYRRGVPEDDDLLREFGRRGLRPLYEQVCGGEHVGFELLRVADARLELREHVVEQRAVRRLVAQAREIALGQLLVLVEVVEAREYLGDGDEDGQERVYRGHGRRVGA